jgi:hypothetical protein
MNEAVKMDKDRLWQTCPHETYEGTKTLEGLAYHEAGHAVIRRLACVGFHAIVIQHRKGVDFAGFVGPDDIDNCLKETRNNDQKLYEPPFDFPEGGDKFIHKALAFRFCCNYLAGLQAELLLHGVEPDPPLIRHDADHIQAKAVLREAFGLDHLQYPQMVTRNYLSQCWGEVKRTAEELLARHEQHGIGIMRRDDPQDISFFSREVPGAKWVDDEWD